MHFSIPDTQDIKDINGSAYQAYNVHINGVLHCVVRYSQVYELNEQLKQCFGNSNVPSFPPKRFLQVKGVDLDERRLRLERYIQEVSQSQILSRSEIFVDFLCKAQQETQREESIPISFDVFLMNGNKINIDICSTDKTNNVLENVVLQLGLKPELTYYFGLYLLKNDPEHQYFLIRKLQEFECPYISLKHLKQRLSYKVVLRTAYWDHSIDEEVCADPVGFKLLTLQAESDINAGWTSSTIDSKKHLSNLKKKGSKCDYLQLCQSLTNYGYIQFKPCLTNYPTSNNTSCVTAGDYQFKISLETDEEDKKEQVFLVTRMKCWKLASQSSLSQTKHCENDVDHPLLELSFEYFFDDGTMEWIKILSEQAIMMSMCIKSMVDELMRKRRGEKIKQPVDHHLLVKPSFKARDKSTEHLFQPTATESSETVSTIQKAKFSVKKLTEKLSLTLLSKPSGSESLSATDNPNSAINFVPTDICRSSFDGIGDEDL